MRSARALIPIALLLLSCGGLTTPTPVVLRETVPVEVTRIVEITSTPPPATPTTAPIFSEGFSGELGGWDLPDEPGVSSTVRDGRLRVEVAQPGAVGTLRHPSLDFLTDFDLRLGFAFISGPPGSTFGVNIDLLSDSSAYGISFSGERMFYLGESQAGTYQAVIPWSPADAILASPAVNHVRLARDGSQLSLWANDVLLASLPLDPLGRGYTTYFFQTFAEGSAVWELDNIELRRP